MRTPIASPLLWLVVSLTLLSFPLGFSSSAKRHLSVMLACLYASRPSVTLTSHGLFAAQKDQTEQAALLLEHCSGLEHCSNPLALGEALFFVALQKFAFVSSILETRRRIACSCERVVLAGCCVDFYTSQACNEALPLRPTLGVSFYSLSSCLVLTI